jgi:GNAT superfamily N-acetyltransferase
MTDDRELSDVQACLRAGIADRAERLGPFLVLINPDSDNPFRNYAVPLAGAVPTVADATRLIECFTERKRLPRLEYVRPAPAVDEALRAVGVDITATLGLMRLGTLVALDAPGYTVEPLADTDPRLRQVAEVQHVAYADDDDPAADVPRLRRTVRDGGCVAIAVNDAGEPAGAGLSTPPRGGLVEIVGIGVLPEHRRRGVAGALVSALTARALDLGLEPFLQVEKDEPLRVYQRVGYRLVGEMADARLLAQPSSLCV